MNRVANARMYSVAPGAVAACAELRDALCLTGFVPVVERDYDRIAAWDQAARAAGYDRPA